MCLLEKGKMLDQFIDSTGRNPIDKLPHTYNLTYITSQDGEGPSLS
jgi:hypothetical protein